MSFDQSLSAKWWWFLPWSTLCAVIVILCFIGSSSCVCLTPSSTLSSQICFGHNQSDPNLVNHRLDEGNHVDASSDNEHSLIKNQSDAADLTLESRSKMDIFPDQFGLPHSSETNKTPRKKVKNSNFYFTGNNRHRNKNPLFIPVAAYSVTKRRPKKKKQSSSNARPAMSASTMSVRQKKPMMVSNVDEENGEDGDEDEESEDDFEMRKESAVYGYIHKPEVIEFRGQYYYGQNEQDQANKYNKQNQDYEGHETIPVSGYPHERHRVSYVPMDSYHDTDQSATSFILAKLKKAILFKGITAKGLLLASLPLMLTPMLSYLLTPVVIPITATVAAGRRRRSVNETVWADDATSTSSNQNVDQFKYQNTLKAIPETKLLEAKILLDYLSKVKPDEQLTTNAVASFLACDGLLLPSDRCLEQLSCEFSDRKNIHALRLERAVTSIIMAHLLQNEFISHKFKKRLKRAAVYGQKNSGQCKSKYPCQRVLLTNQDHGRHAKPHS